LDSAGTAGGSGRKTIGILEFLRIERRYFATIPVEITSLFPPYKGNTKN